MLITGIILGLLAALAQSTSYVFAKSFTAGRPNAKRRLLISSHILMAAVSIPVMIVLWPEKVENYDFLIPGAICAVAYLLAQGMMFVALHSSEASRVSPLLAIKVFIIAGIMMLTGQTSINGVQWVAIILSVAAALCINHAGGSLPLVSLVGVLGASTFYSISDIHIYKLMLCLNDMNPIRATLLAVSICYVMSGLACLPMGIYWRKTLPGDLKACAGFSSAWIIAMLFLFSCFGFVGPIYGNILQSTRGIISIIMGVVIAKLGHHHLEKHITRKVFIARIFAAIALVAAISLYKTSDDKPQPTISEEHKSETGK